MKFFIETGRDRDMSKALNLLQTKLMPHAKKGVACFWKKVGRGKYAVNVTYFATNKLADMLVKLNLKSMVKDIDKKAKLTEMKKPSEIKEFDRLMKS